MADNPELITKREVPSDAIAEAALSTNSQRTDTLPAIGITRRTRKRHTVAEKLRVISYYRETKELDIATNELKQISVKTASARFNIQPRSLRRWLDRERSLKTLPDSRMNVLAPPSSHEQPGNLRLTRRKIVELGIIAKSDWIKVSSSCNKRTPLMLTIAGSPRVPSRAICRDRIRKERSSTYTR